MRCRRPLIPTFAIAVAAVAVLAAGCGGGSSPPASSAGPAAAATDLAGDAMAFAACMRSHGLSGYPDPQVSQSAGHVADQDLAGRTRSHFPGVQVRHPRLRSPSARRGITVRCRQPPGAGAGPALRDLHAHAPSPELPRPRPRRSLHPPLRGRPASAPVPARDESVRERRAKLALHPQPTSGHLLTPRAHVLSPAPSGRGQVRRARVRGPRPGARTSSRPRSGL